MCGRFTLTLPDYRTLALALGVHPDQEQAALYRPRYNLPPMDSHWVLRVKSGERELLPARWGLVPFFAKTTENAARNINARSETVASKPTFREAYKKRRCIVPADGFYEWEGQKGHKLPVWFHPPTSGELLRFAGLYERWTHPDTGDSIRTFTILTTAANDVVAPFHDRMPVILDPKSVDAWLGGEALDLGPAPIGALAAKRVVGLANSVKHDEPACLDERSDEPPPPKPQLSLFGD